MDCHQFAELAGADALGAASESEHRFAQEITDRLPLTVPQVEPSPDVHRHVMAAFQGWTHSDILGQ
jgi:hypothetical protein